jgi:hypothetical protein
MGAIQAKALLEGHDPASPEPDLGQRQPIPEDSRLARGSCRCFGSDRTPGVAPQGVLGVGRYRRL